MAAEEEIVSLLFRIEGSVQAVGYRNFVIEEATYEESQAGNPTLKCKIRITGPQGPAVGKTMFHRFTLVMPGGSSERPEDVSKRERNWKIFFDDMVTLGFDPAWVRSCRTLEPVAQYMIDRRFSSTVTHKPSGGNTYANVSTIMRLPKGMNPPTSRDYVRVIDREPKEGQPEAQWNPEITDDDIPF